MHTDKIPRKASFKKEYERSDAMTTIPLPAAEPARTQALAIKLALAAEQQKELQSACKDLLETLARAFDVKPPKIKILAVRPRKVTESWVYETFGDYDPETTQIRLWMRTAIQKKATSYGTFLATLCHEFCHHLDMVSLDLPETFHTRGFYERTALLYHHIQNTPIKRIVWQEQQDGTYKVDWASTMRAPGTIPGKPAPTTSETEVQGAKGSLARARKESTPDQCLPQQLSLFTMMPGL